MLERFGMMDCKPVSTPLEVKHDQEYANGVHYLALVGSLLYATQTRPDIQFAVGLVSQFSRNPGKPHLTAAKRILGYLGGTADFRLTLGGRNNKEVDIVGWTDSDWAQDPDNRRSVGGFTFDVAGGVVSWSSKKQATVALSTAEAEYMAASNATKEAVWLRTLLGDLGYPQVKATITRAKHIDIRYHFIRERVAQAEIEPRYVPTSNMVADIFTKQILRASFERFRRELGVLMRSEMR